LSGLSTALYVVAPVVFTLLISFALDELAGPVRRNESEWGIAIVIALGLICGGLWGGAIARLAGTGRDWVMRSAGAFSIIPPILFDVWLLITLDEKGVLRRWGVEDWPTHNQYTLVFVTSAFIVAAVGGLALGLAATNWRTAARIAVLTGLGAAASYLLVNVGMDLIGYRVGAPRPGIRPDLPPMPVVTLLGMLAGSSVGGGILGWLLSKQGEQT
jgi:hypothetical protein